jgi:hypothetical protein
MKQIRKISRKEALRIFLLIPLFIIAAIASFILVQATLEGMDALIIVLYVYGWIAFAPCLLVMLVAAFVLCSKKVKVHNAFSIVGIVAKVASEVVIFIFAGQLVFETVSAVPYAILMAYILLITIGSFRAIFKRKRLLAELDAEESDATLPPIADVVDDTAAPQEDYKV